MPVVPPEIMLSKIIANGLVILIAAVLSLALVVQWLLKVPIAGSLALFLAGATLYALTVAALGILLGTIATTMGQFAHGPIRAARGSRAPCHAASVRRRHADGEHACLAA